MEVDSVINKEIRRLMLLIAIAKHDYEKAVINKMPDNYRVELADNLASYQLQKRCLETRNFKALPYCIKQLYNGQK